jgi:transcription elongation GreA/GreB family factor
MVHLQPVKNTVLPGTKETPQTRIMNKADLLHRIIAQLTHNLAVLLNGAKTAHEASTSAENIPDNKYETLALEASYVAQGQANRAQEIREALEVYKQLTLRQFDNNTAIRLTALVTLEAGDGATRTVFIGPLEGGLKLSTGSMEIIVITPGSPLGEDLIGKRVGDVVEVGTGNNRAEYEIVEVC